MGRCSEIVFNSLFSFLLKMLLALCWRKVLYAENKLSCLFHTLLKSIISWFCGNQYHLLILFLCLIYFTSAIHAFLSVSTSFTQVLWVFPKLNSYCLESWCSLIAQLSHQGLMHFQLTFDQLQVVSWYFKQQPRLQTKL